MLLINAFLLMRKGKISCLLLMLFLLLGSSLSPVQPPNPRPQQQGQARYIFLLLGSSLSPVQPPNPRPQQQGQARYIFLLLGSSLSPVQPPNPRPQQQGQARYVFKSNLRTGDLETGTEWFISQLRELLPLSMNLFLRPITKKINYFHKFFL
jgi:hypothetical protein